MYGINFTTNSFIYIMYFSICLIEWTNRRKLNNYLNYINNKLSRKLDKEEFPIFIDLYNSQDTINSTGDKDTLNEETEFFKEKKESILTTEVVTLIDNSYEGVTIFNTGNNGMYRLKIAEVEECKGEGSYISKNTGSYGVFELAKNNRSKQINKIIQLYGEDKQLIDVVWEDNEFIKLYHSYKFKNGKNKEVFYRVYLYKYF
jgi:hypothetical protein